MPLPSLPSKEGAVEFGTLHIGNAFANALFLLLLNVGNSKPQDKNIAEVDAAGMV